MALLLRPLEQLILIYRFRLQTVNTDAAILSLESIGSILGVSTVRVWELEKRALKKLGKSAKLNQLLEEWYE
jgi:DNA-directed RNA polymerase sigma subunit (sigma70/sigma32)